MSTLPEHKYLEAFVSMGQHLEQRMNEHPQAGFRWLKTKPSRPAFADIIFALGNKIFAVIAASVTMERAHFWSKPHGNISIPTEQQNLLVEECAKYGLVPAVFPLYMDGMRPLSTGWNLFALPSMTAFDPIQAAEGAAPAPMSEWELSNFRVNIVLEDLERRGLNILSYQDIPGIYPHIWFEDKEGVRSWIAVVGVDGIQDKNIPTEVRNMQERIPARYIGHVARVGVCSAASMNPTPLRGEGMMVAYKGLERL